MKTKEELNAIREEIAGLATKLKELSDAELEEVIGGYEKRIDVSYLEFDKKVVMYAAEKEAMAPALNVVLNVRDLAVADLAQDNSRAK